jgi:predicted pyridoxine 5'-phosphate oxidase superfamily flavin-nucleotide-binding protein
MALTDKARTLFSQPVFAHVALVDTDGRPHVTPVWVDVDPDGSLWINTAEGRVKDRLLQVGAPYALSATDPENPYDTYPFRQDGEVRVTVVLEPTQVING